MPRVRVACQAVYPLPGQKQKHIRLAYSGIDKEEIEASLPKLKHLLEG